MANITKKAPVFDVEVGVAEGLSVHGGLVALDALARQYGLWDKLRAIRGLDPRKDTSHGFSPEVLVAQLVFSLCSGGAGLSDAERLYVAGLVGGLRASAGRRDGGVPVLPAGAPLTPPVRYWLTGWIIWFTH